MPLLAGTLGLTGCTEEPGVANPGPTTAASSESSAPSSPVTQDSATAALDPCSLLNTATVGKLFPDFTPFKDGEPLQGSDQDETFAGSRSCGWNTDRAQATNQRNALRVTVAIWDKLGVKDAQDAGGGVTAGALGSGRKAAQIPIPDTKGCIVALAVGENARVDVIVGSHEEACDMAAAAADEVDPKLPKG